MTNFITALKSTIDKQVHDLAISNNLVYVDMEGSALNSEQLRKAQDAIAWGHFAYSGEALSPFFTLNFSVGSVTNHDPSQYKSLSTVDNISGVFGVGSSLSIYDFSSVAGPSGPTGPTGGPLGTLFITDASANPLIVDPAEGLRIVAVTARGAKFP